MIATLPAKRPAMLLLQRSAQSVRGSQYATPAVPAHAARTALFGSPAVFWAAEQDGDRRQRSVAPVEGDTATYLSARADRTARRASVNPIGSRSRSANDGAGRATSTGHL